MKLILVRHGQSLWNLENRFTGWCDVPLTEQGKKEAETSGKMLKEQNIDFDIAYTSYLKRAQETLEIILQETKQVPIKKTWMLNERHYGALQGMNKDEARKIFGEEQVHLFRRSANTYPPSLNKEDKQNPAFDSLYKDVDKQNLPLTENLNDVVTRVSSYYNEEIKQQLKQNKNVLLVAHGNSLRALIKYLENITDEEIMNLEIPTGKIYIYEFNDDLSIKNHYFL